MASGIWTAVSGASAQAQAVDTVANNLANVDTQGFKKDLPTFKEYMANVEREKQPLDIPRGPIKEKDLYPLDGKDQAFVVVDGTYTHFRQGNLKVTQSPLDVAIDGPGFLEVSTPYGIRYTRQGSLKMATDGRLVTSQGYPVLSSQPGGLAPALPAASNQPNDQGRSLATQGGVVAELGYVPGSPSDPQIAGRYINLRDLGHHLTINAGGDLYAGDQLVGKLSVTEFQDLKKLTKQGGLLFENRDPANVKSTQQEPMQSVVRQGMIETSNVNPVEEMTNLIKANRLFEHDLKAIKTYGDIMGREANDIGKL